MSVRSSSHLFGFGGLPLGTRDLHPLNLYSVRYNSHHREAAGPSTCYECGRLPQTCPGRLECIPGFRRRYLRLPRGRWQIRPCSARDARRGSARARCRSAGPFLRQDFGCAPVPKGDAHCLTGAVLSFVLAVLDSATTPVLSPTPWPYSSRCQSSFRRGITRTSSTAYGAHWMREPFGMGVKWAVLEDVGVLLPAMSPRCRRLTSS